MYGVDPLSGYPTLQSLRECDFKLQFPCWEVIFEIYSIIRVGIFAAILLFEELTQKFVSLV